MACNKEGKYNGTKMKREKYIDGTGEWVSERMLKEFHFIIINLYNISFGLQEYRSLSLFSLLLSLVPYSHSFLSLLNNLLFILSFCYLENEGANFNIIFHFLKGMKGIFVRRSDTILLFPLILYSPSLSLSRPEDSARNPSVRRLLWELERIGEGIREI